MLPERAGVEFLEYRACLRLLLAGCLGQDAPDSIDIVIDPYGKPYLAAYPELHFNISHSHGLLLVAMAIAPVGVDVEYVREISDWHELSLHLFGAEQTRIIAALAEPMRSYTFLQHFTAQEAKIKALGHGFSGGGLAIVNTMTDCTYLMTVRLPDIPGYTSHLCITSG